MKFRWDFWRKVPVPDAPKEAPHKELPETMGVEGYLDKALTPEGRISGTRHPETNPKYYKLSGTPEANSIVEKRVEGNEADADTRARMMLLLCEATGQQVPSDLDALSLSRDSVPDAVGSILGKLAGQVGYEKLNAAVEERLRAHTGPTAREEDMRSWKMAANWLMMKAKDAGLK